MPNNAVALNNNDGQQSHLTTTDIVNENNTVKTDLIEDNISLSLTNREENAIDFNFSFFDDFNSVATESSSINTANNNDSLNSWNNWILKWRCK
ncbi:hypothetical protein ABK040_002760 [Willaertia magna]